MLELMSPADSAAAVIAAVQSGADTIYMGFSVSDTDTDQGLTREELARSLRYCRVRGCRAAVVIDELVTDDSLDQVVERAVFAVHQGAQALIIQDVGLIAVLRRTLPETPLWGSVRMDIHSTDAALAAAAMGLRRIILAPELGGEQIAQIAKSVPAEIAVLVHGPLCFSHIGQCYLRAMNEGRHSDAFLPCNKLCRGHFSLGGRKDDAPMSVADAFLIGHLEELENAGVACAVIGGLGRRPEYISYVTGLYSRTIRDHVLPTDEERERLLELFAPYGLTDGTFTGTPLSAAVAEDQASPRQIERGCAEIRKSYMDGERRRIPVTFYAVIQQGRPAKFGAEDDRGHRAVYEGYAPIDLGREGITEGRVQELMFRTGGTPYNCVGVRCIIDPHMDYPDEEIEVARRALLGQITDQARDPATAVIRDVPKKPARSPRMRSPQFILQVTRADQLSEALASVSADALYVPAELLAAGESGLEPFRAAGTTLCAVLPRIVTDEEKPVLRELLAAVKGVGVSDVLIGSTGQLPAVLEAGLVPRGDYGLNVTNTWTAECLAGIGLRSVTASFLLSVKQIRSLSPAADTEMIIYGRVPVMVTEQCLIRASSGRCSCSTPTSMSDDNGNTWPVEKEFSCRNIVYDHRKIFLADRPDVYQTAGLWGVRLLFTTESARECADVARRYCGMNRYQPNNISRGVYPKGAL